MKIIINKALDEIKNRTTSKSIQKQLRKSGMSPEEIAAATAPFKPTPPGTKDDTEMNSPVSPRKNKDSQVAPAPMNRAQRRAAARSAATAGPQNQPATGQAPTLALPASRSPSSGQLTVSNPTTLATTGKEIKKDQPNVSGAGASSSTPKPVGSIGITPGYSPAASNEDEESIPALPAASNVVDAEFIVLSPEEQNRMKQLAGIPEKVAEIAKNASDKADSLAAVAEKDSSKKPAAEIAQKNADKLEGATGKPTLTDEEIKALAAELNIGTDTTPDDQKVSAAPTKPEAAAPVAAPPATATGPSASEKEPESKEKAEPDQKSPETVNSLFNAKDWRGHEEDLQKFADFVQDTIDSGDSIENKIINYDGWLPENIKSMYSVPPSGDEKDSDGDQLDKYNIRGSKSGILKTVANELTSNLPKSKKNWFVARDSVESEKDLNVYLGDLERDFKQEFKNARLKSLTDFRRKLDDALGFSLGNKTPSSKQFDTAMYQFKAVYNDVDRMHKRAYINTNAANAYIDGLKRIAEIYQEEKLTRFSESLVKNKPVVVKEVFGLRNKGLNKVLSLLQFLKPEDFGLISKRGGAGAQATGPEVGVSAAPDAETAAASAAGGAATTPPSAGGEAAASASEKATNTAKDIINDPEGTPPPSGVSAVGGNGTEPAEYSVDLKKDGQYLFDLISPQVSVIDDSIEDKQISLIVVSFLKSLRDRHEKSMKDFKFSGKPFRKNQLDEQIQKRFKLLAGILTENVLHENKEDPDWIFCDNFTWGSTGEHVALRKSEAIRNIFSLTFYQFLKNKASGISTVPFGRIEKVVVDASTDSKARVKEVPKERRSGSKAPPVVKAGRISPKKVKKVASEKSEEKPETKGDKKPTKAAKPAAATTPMPAPSTVGEPAQDEKPAPVAPEKSTTADEKFKIVDLKDENVKKQIKVSAAKLVKNVSSREGVKDFSEDIATKFIVEFIKHVNKRGNLNESLVFDSMFLRMKMLAGLLTEQKYLQKEEYIEEAGAPPVHKVADEFVNNYEKNGTIQEIKEIFSVLKGKSRRPFKTVCTDIIKTLFGDSSAITPVEAPEADEKGKKKVSDEKPKTAEKVKAPEETEKKGFSQDDRREIQKMFQDILPKFQSFEDFSKNQGK